MRMKETRNYEAEGEAVTEINEAFAIEWSFQVTESLPFQGTESLPTAR
jgi:hypothetical protein